MELYKAANITTDNPARVIHKNICNPPLRSHEVKAADWHFSPWKRCFDVLLSFVLIIALLSWLSLLLCIIIKISSRGPVLFSQKRIGKNGKIFTCYKFRTMHLNDASDAVQAKGDDMRITSAGRFLRTTHIDELLQLINILLGDMSFIGPRPHMLSDDTLFSALSPDYDRRKCVKPGLTGLAQIKGFHGFAQDILSISSRTKMDLLYIRKASLLLDVKILLATLLTPFSTK